MQSNLNLPQEKVVHAHFASEGVEGNMDRQSPITVHSNLNLNEGKAARAHHISERLEVDIDQQSPKTVQSNLKLINNSSVCITSISSDSQNGISVESAKIGRDTISPQDSDLTKDEMSGSNSNQGNYVSGLSPRRKDLLHQTIHVEDKHKMALVQKGGIIKQLDDCSIEIDIKKCDIKFSGNSEESVQKSILKTYEMLSSVVKQTRKVDCLAIDLLTSQAGPEFIESALQQRNISAIVYVESGSIYAHAFSEKDAKDALDAINSKLINRDVDISNDSQMKYLKSIEWQTYVQSVEKNNFVNIKMDVGKKRLTVTGERDVVEIVMMEINDHLSQSGPSHAIQPTDCTNGASTSLGEKGDGFSPPDAQERKNRSRDSHLEEQRPIVPSAKEEQSADQSTRRGVVRVDQGCCRCLKANLPWLYENKADIMRQEITFILQ